jgi:hypothetical protein
MCENESLPISSSAARPECGVADSPIAQATLLRSFRLQAQKIFDRQPPSTVRQVPVM